jgi:hypothetical protein
MSAIETEIEYAELLFVKENHHAKTKRLHLTAIYIIKKILYPFQVRKE